MKLGRREKIILYICIFLAVIMAMDGLVFSPLASRLLRLNQEIKATEAKLTRGLSARTQKDRILSEYKQYEKYLKISGSDEEIVSEFLREIEKLAREAGVGLSDIKPRSSSKHPMYKEFTIEVRTEARLKEAVAFLYSLNNSNLLLRLEKLVLAPQEEKSDILKINMVISGIAVL